MKKTSKENTSNDPEVTEKENRKEYDEKDTVSKNAPITKPNRESGDKKDVQQNNNKDSTETNSSEKTQTRVQRVGIQTLNS